MPSLAESTGLDLSSMGYSPVDGAGSAKPSSPAPTTNLEPGYNKFLRCPIPPVWQSSPDSLRQFYNNGIVPQNRLFNPPTS